MARKRRIDVPIVSLNEVAARSGWAALYNDEQPIVAVAFTPRQIRSLLETLDEVHNLRAYSPARDHRPMSTVLESILREAIQDYRTPAATP